MLKFSFPVFCTKGVFFRISGTNWFLFSLDLFWSVFADLAGNQYASWRATSGLFDQ